MSVPVDELFNLLQRFQQKVQKSLPESYDDELFNRLKRNIATAQAVAPSHDFENIECNGVRMLLQHAQLYLQVVDKKKKEEEISDFLEVLKILDLWFSFVDAHKELETAGE